MSQNIDSLLVYCRTTKCSTAEFGERLRSFLCISKNDDINEHLVTLVVKAIKDEDEVQVGE